MTTDLLDKVAAVIRKQRGKIDEYEKKARELRYADTALLMIGYKMSRRADGGLIGLLRDPKLWSHGSDKIDPDISGYLRYIFGDDKKIDLSVECRRLKGLEMVLDLDPELKDLDWTFYDAHLLVEIIKKNKLKGLEKLVNQSRAADDTDEPINDPDEDVDDVDPDTDDDGTGTASDILDPDTPTVPRQLDNHPGSHPDVLIQLIGHADMKSHYERRDKLMIQIDEDGRAEVIHIDQEGRHRLMDREIAATPDAQELFAHVLSRVTSKDYAYQEENLFARTLAELDLRPKHR